MTAAAGLYDQLLSEALERWHREQSAPGQLSIEPLPPAEAAERLGAWLGAQLSDLLDALPDHQQNPRLEQQVALVNGLLAHLRQLTRGEAEPLATLPPSPGVLRAVHPPGRQLPMPAVGLAAPWLFSAARGSPALMQELRAELGSSQRVDMLVSFIKTAGVRKLLDVLREVTAVGANGEPGLRLRVLTTTYTGATEQSALDDLAKLPGCEVRISLDGSRTRLHAKAWIFERDTGFGSAYVGSANLTGAAMMGGLEWTVKFTQAGQSDLFQRARAQFETLWADPEFQPYDPHNDEHRSRLAQALKREGSPQLPLTATWFDLVPRPFQQEMLDRLDAERARGRTRNLLVAATGTGKTVVAAFDYRRSCEQLGGRPRLLFVAHRAEILRQALRTFREVLRDASFGEILAGGAQPAQHDHLFATIDSLTSRETVSRLGADYWHTVIVDECHRIAADRFDALLRSLRPAILLGLTATPERADGQSILGYFDLRPDHAPAAELRLWHALDLQLLAPFEYYACDDDTAFRDVKWNAPGELASLDRVLTGNQQRARLIASEWQRLSGNARATRALAFCVSVNHARFMAECFNRAGLPAVCLHGESSDDERRAAPERLRSGELCVIVTVDLYNEGVDLPFVDTLLLLRPTQSPVVFQQQIGRGLRLSPETGKNCCLVLDFVGQYSADFRFDVLLSPLTGLNRRELAEAVEHGFSTLPSGCHVQLQRRSAAQVLSNLRTLTNTRWKRLSTELAAYASLQGREGVTLAGFVRDQGLALSDIFRDKGESGWNALRRQAGLACHEPEPVYQALVPRLSSLLHLDDPAQLSAVQALACDAVVRGSGPDEALALRWQMLTYQIDGQHRQVGSWTGLRERLRQSPAAREDLLALTEALALNETAPPRPVPGLEAVPLALHAHYMQREVLTAFGLLTADKRIPFRAGTLPMNDRRVEVLFVTLDKTSGFHERIAYHDYAISPDRFHWQTQNSAAPGTRAGQRYLEHADNGWRFLLLVRGTTDDAYQVCGWVRPLHIEGARPMSITFALDTPMTAAMFQRYSVLRAA